MIAEGETGLRLTGAAAGDISGVAGVAGVSGCAVISDLCAKASKGRRLGRGGSDGAGCATGAEQEVAPRLESVGLCRTS